MLIHRRWRLFLSLVAAVAYAAPALAQQPPATDQPAPAAATPATKKHPKHKPSAAPAAATEPAAAVAGGTKPTLLGQFGDWGAYAASPGGKKICFAIAKPASSETSPAAKTRNPSYMFVASRPADKVSNEISIIIGYPFKPNSDATIAVGSSSFALYTQQDGAWIKNATEEAQLIEAMRGGQNAVVKGTSAKGTRSTDIFSLKGLAQALDRSGQDCKPQDRKP
jgi:Invasion associated locus B (IalB) protein